MGTCSYRAPTQITAPYVTPKSWKVHHCVLYVYQRCCTKKGQSEIFLRWAELKLAKFTEVQKRQTALPYVKKVKLPEICRPDGSIKQRRSQRGGFEGSEHPALGISRKF